MYTTEELCPQLIIKVMDNELGFLGYVVIDRVIGGKAVGGVRMAEDLTLEEVANLAREMTLKFGFLNIPQGGAKAGVIGISNLALKDREKLFLTFGEKIAPLLNRYIYYHGEDLGTFHDDIVNIAKGAGLPIKLKKKNDVNPAYFPALTVFITADSLTRDMNLNLSDCTIAIEGFGKVGESAAELFSESGARVVAISTIKGAIYNPQGLEVEELMRLRKDYGDDLVRNYNDTKIIGNKELLALDVDILVPCARPDAINDANISELKAKIVVPGANIPATMETEELIFARGIQYVPGFVSNCGAVLGYYLMYQGFNKDDIERIMREGLGNKISEMFANSVERGVPIGVIAREISEKNLQRMGKEVLANRSTKALSFLRDSHKRSTKDFVIAIMWILYRLSLKYSGGFVFKPFAIRHVMSQLFGGPIDYSH